MTKSILEQNVGYEGKYVATCSPDSQKVVSSADTPIAAINQAKEAGCKDPVLVYVPTKDEQTFLF